MKIIHRIIVTLVSSITGVFGESHAVFSSNGLASGQTLHTGSFRVIASYDELILTQCATKCRLSLEVCSTY